MLRYLALLLFGISTSSFASANVVSMNDFIAKRNLTDVVGLYENTERYGESFLVSVAISEGKLIISSVEEGHKGAARSEYDLTQGERSRKINHPMIGEANEYSVVIIDKGHYVNRRTTESVHTIIEESIDVNFSGEELIIRIQRVIISNKGYKVKKDDKNNFRETLWLEKISSKPLTVEELVQERKARELLRQERREIARGFTEATILPFKLRSCKQLFQ